LLFSYYVFRSFHSTIISRGINYMSRKVDYKRDLLFNNKSDKICYILLPVCKRNVRYRE